jgi:hypothetical protein
VRTLLKRIIVISFPLCGGALQPPLAVIPASYCGPSACPTCLRQTSKRPVLSVPNLSISQPNLLAKSSIRFANGVSFGA